MRHKNSDKINKKLQKKRKINTKAVAGEYIRSSIRRNFFQRMANCSCVFDWAFHYPPQWRLAMVQPSWEITPLSCHKTGSYFQTT